MRHNSKNIYDDLKRDIYDELFYWIDKKGKDYFFSISDFFYRSRSGLLTGVLANLPGTKILIGVDSASDLDAKVRKLSLMYDYVIIRHRTFTPPQGLIVDSAPADFAGFGKPDYLDKYESELSKGWLFPHLKSAPHRSEIIDFHEWVAGPGKSWLTDGNVVYAPFLISSDVEMAAYKDEVSFSGYYLDANVFPAEDERFVAFSDVVSNLTLPVITGCSADWLKKFREDNSNSLDAFRNYLFQLIDKSISFDGDSSKYNKDVITLSDGVLADLEKIRETMKNQRILSTPKNKDITFDLIPIAVSFFTGLPPWATALTLIPSARHFVNNIVESYKAMKEIKKSPLYIMTKLK